MGQTAFVCKSHIMSECALMMSVASESVLESYEQKNNNNLNKIGWDYGYGDIYCRNMLIRPHLSLGDALIFDCRILHFGLGNYMPIDTNTNNNTNNNYDNNININNIRSMLYINSHYKWFHDSKNWGSKKLFK